MMQAAADDTNADEALANAALAAEGFNSAYAAAAASKKGDSLILAPSFGCPTSPYTALQSALAKTSTPLTMYATENFATIDLRALLRSNITFIAERKLQACLLEEGLVMVPGEACGLEEPGYFRICAPKLSSADVDAIVHKIAHVAKKFNPATKRHHADHSVEPSSIVEAVHDREAIMARKHAEEEEGSVAEASVDGRESTRKRRKN